MFWSGTKKKGGQVLGEPQSIWLLSAFTLIVKVTYQEKIAMQEYCGVFFASVNDGEGQTPVSCEEQ